MIGNLYGELTSAFHDVCFIACLGKFQTNLEATAVVTAFYYPDRGDKCWVRILGNFRENYLQNSWLKECCNCIPKVGSKTRFESSANKKEFGFEVFTVVTMAHTVFRGVVPCGFQGTPPKRQFLSKLHIGTTQKVIVFKKEFDQKIHPTGN
jgi:hypothetical protein